MAFSNYPRPNDPVAFPVPVQELSRLIKFGSGWGIAWFLSITALSGIAELIGEPETYSITQDIIFAVGLLVMLVCSVGFAVVVFSWVRLAWQTVCRLRSLSPRLSANAAAWLSVLPFVNFVGLMFVMDWLLIRSRSSTERTLKWYSTHSSAPIVTVFLLALTVHCLLMTLAAFSSFAKYLPTTSLGWNIAECASHGVCLWLGYKISKSVNENLASFGSDSSP